MQVNVKKIELSEVKNEILAIALWQGESLPFTQITKAVKKEEFEAKQGQVCILDSQEKTAFRKLFLYGLGEKKEFNIDFLRRFGGAAVRYAASLKTTNLSFFAKIKEIDTSDAVHAICEGAILSNYKPIQFKSKKEDYYELKEIDVISKENVEGAISRAKILANAQNYVREINENPANIATPQKLAEYAKELSKENKLSIKIIEKDEIRKLKMNAILGVNQGSALPPVMVVLEYNKDKKDLPLYAVVGKGITFDSGGISIKPAKGMQDMKYDKTGAVTTLGIIKAVSELKLPIRLIGAFTATENMPSGSAQKPGDIVTSYNGKTIEVLNTDAEGRLILSDTLAYVAESKPKAMIDLATLTGAMIVALGKVRIGLFSNDDEISDAIYKAGEKTFERVWRMPMDKEYKEMNKADFADVKNIGSEGGEAGSITAACFLSEFIEETKWAHLDIAGVDNIADRHAYLEKGASGIGVRLVCETLEDMAKK